MGLVFVANLAERQSLVAALQRLGISPLGVNQFLGGQIVVDPADRSKLASLLARAQQSSAPSLGFQGGCSRGDMERFGISSPGVEQFLKGQIVLDPTDRSLLADYLTHHLMYDFVPVHVTS